MAIDPGTQTARFLQGRSYDRYIARVGPSVHENVQSYCEATDLLSTDSKTAAIAKLLSFCVRTICRTVLRHKRV